MRSHRVCRASMIANARFRTSVDILSKWIFSTGYLMNDSFYWYMFKRCVFFSILLAGFCMLPGPRRIVANAVGHLLTPESQDSLWCGFHLSLIHLCWLFDFKMQLLPYAESVDPLLANSAFLFGILLQVAVVGGVWMLSNFAFLYYDPERPTEEMVDVVEELSVEPLSEPRASEIQLSSARSEKSPRVRAG